MSELIALATMGMSGLATALVLGTIFGFIAGLVPGIGGRIGIILCIPFATFFDPLSGAVFLFAMHSVVHTAASIPAIVFALPSTAADAATVLDGYPLAKKGKAGLALGASLSASAIGGVLGAIAFLTFIPIARPLIVWFGPPEFLLLAIAGLSMVVILSGRSLLTGSLAGCFGFLIAMVGLDMNTSQPRFTFEIPELIEGINLAALIGGIFVVPEMLSRWSFDKTGRQRAISTGFSDLMAGMRSTFSHLPLVIRSTFYGIGIGVMPGLGSSISVWISYAWAARNSHSKIPFGEGAIEGVIAPETANNSKEGGAMVPTLFFGIPGSSSMAIMLGAFVIIGVPVGPSLLNIDIHIPVILALTVLLANLIAIPVFFAVIPGIVRLAALQRSHMVPFAISISLFAALYQNMHSAILLQFVVFALIGIMLKWADWPRVPFLLGFIMGPLAEISYIQTSQIWGWSMFFRPASIIMIAIITTVAFRVIRFKPSGKNTAIGSPDLMLGLTIFTIFLAALIQIWEFSVDASTFPLMISFAGLGLALLTVGKGLAKGLDSPHKSGQFDGLLPAAFFCLAVLPIGLPAASALYAGFILISTRTHLVRAVIWSLALALAQILLFSLVMDILAEPLITGLIFASNL